MALLKTALGEWEGLFSNIFLSRVPPIPAGALGCYGADVSEDAGRYVCNYTYYTSLYECDTRNSGGHGPRLEALFVHVPLFSSVTETEQLAFLRQLLNELGRCGVSSKSNLMGKLCCTM